MMKLPQNFKINQDFRGGQGFPNKQRNVERNGVSTSLSCAEFRKASRCIQHFPLEAGIVEVVGMKYPSHLYRLYWLYITT